MSGLAFAQAPPPSHPLRLLLAATGWGVVAGLWLAVHGEAAMLTRWTPATLVLVHMLTLGLLTPALSPACGRKGASTAPAKAFHRLHGRFAPDP
ncbi:hypothetical protein [Pseudoxanthomonas suwonensis]|uniref:hypothetical protein n=1 Tax=Pseudoxanthomonas suwonensis TaxID=314722 RepID=UPI000B0D12CC|nr:hypothetical protein [Pseudoxanthomonas suwonensis]